MCVDGAENAGANETSHSDNFVHVCISLETEAYTKIYVHIDVICTKQTLKVEILLYANKPDARSENKQQRQWQRQPQQRHRQQQQQQQ